MSRVKIKLNRAGVQALLRSKEVQADLKKRADAIRAGAGDGYTSDVSAGGKRARATVAATEPRAMAHELKHKSLVAGLSRGK